MLLRTVILVRFVATKSWIEKIIFSSSFSDLQYDHRFHGTLFWINFFIFFFTFLKCMHNLINFWNFFLKINPDWTSSNLFKFWSSWAEMGMAVKGVADNNIFYRLEGLVAVNRVDVVVVVLTPPEPIEWRIFF